jgi:hypothetical protein
MSSSLLTSSIDFEGLCHPKSSFDSLVSHAYTAISKQAPGSKKLRSCGHILSKQDRIDSFVSTTIYEINAGILQPAKYTDPKGCRRFTLLPICSMQATHIQLDLQTFPYILRRAGLYTGSNMTEERYRQICWQNFNFQVLGINSIEDLSQERMEFR